MKMPKLQTVIMVLGALLAVNLLIAAGSQSSKDDGPELPSAIERLIPPRGTLIRLQDDVGVDLDNAYKGRLVINRVVIPDDEVIWIPSLGKLTFRPGEGRAVERWPEGVNSVTVFFLPQDENRGEPERSFTWDFLAS
jgi:hypothetical protein